jgi:hypothetical protein
MATSLAYIPVCNWRMFLFTARIKCNAVSRYFSVKDNFLFIRAIFLHHFPALYRGASTHFLRFNLINFRNFPWQWLLRPAFLAGIKPCDVIMHKIYFFICEILANPTRISTFTGRFKQEVNNFNDSFRSFFNYIQLKSIANAFLLLITSFYTFYIATNTFQKKHVYILYIISIFTN